MNITHSVKTAYHANDNGAGRITAKCKGKQRTIPYDHGLSIQANHLSAAGEVLNVVLDPLAQAKLRHPSGKQRLRVMTFDNGTGIINISV